MTQSRMSKTAHCPLQKHSCVHGRFDLAHWHLPEHRFLHVSLMSSLQPFDAPGRVLHKAPRFSHCRVSNPTPKDLEVLDLHPMPDPRHVLPGKNHALYVEELLVPRRDVFQLPITV